MYNNRTGTERPVIWIGSSRRDVRGFPREVRRNIGQALYAGQQGETDPSAKPLRGFGGGSVLEIIVEHHGDTWRTVYTVRYCGGDLRFARLPEEIEKRYRHTQEGHGPHLPAPS
jgi:phage-related protein